MSAGESPFQSAEAAWREAIGQLQTQMPKGAFERYVQDTRVIRFDADGNVLVIGAPDDEASDWLAARLSSTVARLLVGSLKQVVQVQFVTVEPEAPEAEDDDPDLSLEAVDWLDYERIVQPQRQVVVKGYLRRLGAEIGPKAIWLYIGFHQAAWMSKSRGDGAALSSRQVRRFTGMSFGAFWRLMRAPTTWQQLGGLVRRLDPVGARSYRRGADGRPHRMPVHYQVSMTPRLTRLDAAVIYDQLARLVAGGADLSEALQTLLDCEDTLELLACPAEGGLPAAPGLTVLDLAGSLAGRPLSPGEEQLAQALQRKIVNCLGDIHLTHYFITRVIPGQHLTPAQAWLVAVARDLAYLNWRTGERREVVTFQGGYQEMAALVGSSRPKTVQAWFTPDWQRGRDLTLFLQELELPDHDYADLRTETRARRYRVLLDEPLGANGSHRLDANGSHSQSRMEALVDANGSHMLGANGTVLNTYKHPLNTCKENTSTTQTNEQAAAEPIPAFWELKSLLEQNNVHPRLQQELLAGQASAIAFVSWVLYAAGLTSGSLSDPLGYALSRLRREPAQGAQGIFGQLADLPPVELLTLIRSTPTQRYQLPADCRHPLAASWKQVMGARNPKLGLVLVILFGQGDSKK